MPYGAADMIDDGVFLLAQEMSWPFAVSERRRT